MTAEMFVPRAGGARGISYRLAVPPGVLRLPGHVLDQLPLIEAQLDRADLAAEVGRAVAALSASGPLAATNVLDSYVTAGVLPDCGLAMSVVVSATSLSQEKRHGMTADFAHRGGPGRAALTVGGEAAVVLEAPLSTAGRPVTGGMRVLRAKTVISCVPGDDDVLISFAVMVAQLEGGASPDTSEDETQAVADALVELFDAMMTTVRWLDDQGRVITDRPTT
jgi:hypothetical protein